MTKAEFLENLELKLIGEVDERIIRQNLRYYSDYIDSAIREGKSESEVMGELGSPLLIAKTIIDTAGQGENQRYTGESYEKTDQDTGEGYSHQTFHLDIGSRWGKWIILGVVILVLFLLFTVLRILLPILLPVILVLFLITLFKK